MGIESGSGLVGEPRLLLDSRLMGALHADLEADLGFDEAAESLLQMGFLQGLESALAALRHSFASGEAEPPPLAPPLAIRLCANPRPGQPGAIELIGSWPEAAEAEARRSSPHGAREGSCFLSAGYTAGWLSGILDANVIVLETSCSAAGDDACRFVAREAEVWDVEAEPRAERLLAALPFDALREMAEAHEPSLPGADPGGFDPDAAVVHIWGPVMVLPFTGADEALRAIDLIGRDPEAAAVSVVVVDLTGAVLDDAFGAVALEQIVECLESIGADVLFAGVSPLAEAAVADLDRQPLMIHKDLQHGIAAAFRIADAQRRLL